MVRRRIGASPGVRAAARWTRTHRSEAPARPGRTACGGPLPWISTLLPLLGDLSYLRGWIL